jgi:uncharacterized membrane protein
MLKIHLYRNLFMRIIIFITMTVIAYACYYDNEEYLYPQLDTTCDTTTVTFSSSVQPVLQENCLSCHSNNSASSLGGNIKLEDYQDVKQRADDGSLLGTISHESGYSPMPKGASRLNNCKISIIKIWINSGSPDN